MSLRPAGVAVLVDMDGDIAAPLGLAHANLYPEPPNGEINLSD